MKPTEIRVRYKETDKMGVVYHSNYLVWLEVARTELFRGIGLPYTDLEKRGLFLMVVDVSCRFKHPARYDDIVYIDCQISEIKNTSITFEYTVKKDKRLLATATSVHIFCDRKGKPEKIPSDLREKLEQSKR